MEAVKPRRSQIIRILTEGGGKKEHDQGRVIEAVISVVPMTKKRANLSLRRRIKRKDHKEDDILDCPSLKEDDFSADPLIEGQSSESAPYKTNVEALSPPPCVNSEFESTKSSPISPIKSATEKGGTIILTRSATSNIAPQSPRAANWDLIKKWEEYSSVQPSTSATTGTKQKERKKNKLRPSPLAKNVGTLLENMGHVAADFFIHLCHLTSKAISYQGPIGVLLIITCLYYSIMYLEISLANSAEIILEWVWPVVHLVLRSTEQCLRAVTNFVQSIDELGESVVCDWAQLWCAQFDLMCHQKCSFTSKTLERFRHS